MDEDQPVDGFTIGAEGDQISLVLSNRYGSTDSYLFDPYDAIRIGKALVVKARQLIQELSG